MYKNLTLTFFACLFVASTSFGQETWSLEKCIRYAWENNISIKGAELSVADSRLVEKANKFSRLPSVNGNVSGAYQFGRTIDPVTNQFNSLSIGTNRLALDAGVTIYNGNRINNSIKQAGYNLQASMNDLAQMKNDISLSIASSYLNILFAQEQLDAAVKRKELSESQLDQVDKLIRAGARPQNDRLEILATIARNDQSIIAQENAVENGLLSLKNLLLLEPDKDIQIERPQSITIAVEENPDLLKFSDLYNSSIKNQPFIKADENRVKSAELGKDIARAGLMPRLSAFAGLSTNYSTRGQRLDGTFEDVTATQPALIDETPTTPVIPITLLIPQVIPGREDNPYSNQLNENFGQNIGLSLSIPIYNNHQNLVNIDRAELNILRSQLTAETNKQNLKNNIQTALANAKAAKRTLAASERTRDASQAAFENSEKQFQLGTINTFEYATAKNNLDQAEVDLIIAKYDYLFKLKVLDFYQGKKLELK